MEVTLVDEKGRFVRTLVIPRYMHEIRLPIFRAPKTDYQENKELEHNYPSYKTYVPIGYNNIYKERRRFVTWR